MYCSVDYVYCLCWLLLIHFTLLKAVNIFEGLRYIVMYNSILLHSEYVSILVSEKRQIPDESFGPSPDIRVDTEVSTMIYAFFIYGMLRWKVSMLINRPPTCIFFFQYKTQKIGLKKNYNQYLIKKPSDNCGEATEKLTKEKNHILYTNIHQLSISLTTQLLYATIYVTHISSNVP